MKSLATIIISLFSLVAHAQETTPAFDGHQWEAPYHLPIPTDWTIERFLIPISFAPQIPYHGVEDIRFAPGWGLGTGDEYWSYAFLWYLDGEVETDAKTIESNLQAYYTGLVAVNGSNIPSEKLVPVRTSFKKVKKAEGDLSTYFGTVFLLDYLHQNPIILNCKVHVKSCTGDNHTLIFFELSPQLLSHHIWLKLDQLWSDFRCSSE